MNGNLPRAARAFAGRLAGVAGIVLVVATAAALPARAGNVHITSSAGTSASVSVTSFADRPFITVVRQEYDFSCGSAAIATLLTYHFQHPTTENQAFNAMYATGDQAKIRREGFSLLDMKRYLDSQGYQSNGFRVTLDKIAHVGIPVIALITTKGYKHFVVIAGVRNGEVLLADPARGLTAISQAEFQKMWNGIVLAVINHSDVGRTAFNQQKEWSIPRPAPLESGVDRSGIATLTTMLPEPGFF